MLHPQELMGINKTALKKGFLFFINIKTTPLRSTYSTLTIPVTRIFEAPNALAATVHNKPMGPIMNSRHAPMIYL